MLQGIFVVICVLVAIPPFFVSAHGTGASFERTVGDYLIDIGYEPEQPAGGDRIVFDFNLADATATGTEVEYDYVWVRMQHEGATLLASSVHRAEVGPTTLLFTLPKDTQGDVSLYARFQKGDETLAESEFTLPVAAHEEESKWEPLLFVGVAGIALGFLVFMWKKRRKTSGILRT